MGHGAHQTEVCCRPSPSPSPVWLQRHGVVQDARGAATRKPTSTYGARRTLERRHGLLYGPGGTLICCILAPYTWPAQPLAAHYFCTHARLPSQLWPCLHPSHARPSPPCRRRWPPHVAVTPGATPLPPHPACPRCSTPSAPGERGCYPHMWRARCSRCRRQADWRRRGEETAAVH